MRTSTAYKPLLIQSIKTVSRLSNIVDHVRPLPYPSYKIPATTSPFSVVPEEKTYFHYAVPIENFHNQIKKHLPIDMKTLEKKKNLDRTVDRTCNISRKTNIVSKLEESTYPKLPFTPFKLAFGKVIHFLDNKSFKVLDLSGLSKKSVFSIENAMDKQDLFIPKGGDNAIIEKLHNREKKRLIKNLNNPSSGLVFKKDLSHAPYELSNQNYVKDLSITFPDARSDSKTLENLSYMISHKKIFNKSGLLDNFETAPSTLQLYSTYREKNHNRLDKNYQNQSKESHPGSQNIEESPKFNRDNNGPISNSGSNITLPTRLKILGSIIIDSRRISQLMASTQAREASLPPSTRSNINLSTSAVYTGIRISQ